MQLGEPDASGRRRPVPIEGSEFVVEAETLIPAIGQRADLSLCSRSERSRYHALGHLQRRQGDLHDQRAGRLLGRRRRNRAGYRDPRLRGREGKPLTVSSSTSRPNARRDRPEGGAELTAESFVGEDRGCYEKKGRYIVEFQDIPSPRQHFIEIDVDERRDNYREVELGFDEERALREAKRCLSCRRCLGCALCWAECKPEAIVFEMEDESFELEAESVIISPGVERALDRIDAGFGLGKVPNVVTDLQLERMLSDSGPSAGLIIRPYDGEVPGSIAFVQGYGSAAPEMHRAALAYAVNEAIIARDKMPQAEIAVYASPTESFLAAYGADLQKLDRIALKDTAVGEVQESADHGLMFSLGSNGNGETKHFDLVVLITQPQVSKDLKNLSKGLGLTLAYASFLTEAGTGLITTDKESINLTAQA